MEQFNFSKIDKFDEHIRSSIQGYDNLSHLLINYLPKYIQRNTNIIDIGASTGLMLSSLKEKYDPNCKFYAVDNAENMIQACKARGLNPIKLDLESKLPNIKNISVGIMCFTLQFLSLNAQIRIIDYISANSNKNAVIAIAEKVHQKNTVDNDLLESISLQYKMAHFDSGDILLKNFAIRYCMNTNYEKYTIDLMKKFSLQHKFKIWQNGNFLCNIFQKK